MNEYIPLLDFYYYHDNKLNIKDSNEQKLRTANQHSRLMALDSIENVVDLEIGVSNDCSYDFDNNFYFDINNNSLSINIENIGQYTTERFIKDSIESLDSSYYDSVKKVIIYYNFTFKQFDAKVYFNNIEVKNKLLLKKNKNKNIIIYDFLNPKSNRLTCNISPNIILKSISEPHLQEVCFPRITKYNINGVNF